MKKTEKFAVCLKELKQGLCDNLEGFSIHGIFQARVLEWGSIAFADA